MIKLLGNPLETSSDFDQFDTLFRAHDIYEHVKAAAEAAAADVKVGGEMTVDGDMILTPKLNSPLQYLTLM